MITDIFLSLVTGILIVIQGVFSVFNFIIPVALTNSFATFFGYLQIGDGVFPVSQALLAIVTVLTVWLLLYGIKVILWAFSLIPFIGKVVHLPNHGGVTEGTSESFDSKGQSLGTRKYRSERK